MLFVGGFYHSLARDLQEPATGGRYAHFVFQQGKRCCLVDKQDVMLMIDFCRGFLDGHSPGNARKRRQGAKVCD